MEGNFSSLIVILLSVFAAELESFPLQYIGKNLHESNVKSELQVVEI